MEWGRSNLEDVARLGVNRVAERQRRRAEEMNVYVARTPEQRIFEMVMLKVGDAVRHVRFARYERLFP